MKIFWFLSVLVVIILSSFVGKVPLDTGKIFDPSSMEFQIFTQVRFPRVLLAFLSGGVLALSGLLFQNIFRNDLTTPFTLGISGGATLGASLVILAGFGSSGFLGISYITVFSFFGALLTLLLIYFISKRLGERSTTRLILVGIALSFLYSSFLLIFYYLSSFEQSYQILRYTMGSLLTVGFSDLLIVLIGAVLLLAVSFYFKKILKLLSISYEFAFLKGIDIENKIMTLFIVISFSVGLLVSVTGPIGFIGLIVPHMVKRVLKKSIDELLVATFVSGGVFLVICDTIARSLPTVSEIPVGIVTSFIGGIVFIYILLKKR